MKRILFLLALLPMLITSCSKDDEADEQTIMINVSYQYEGSQDTEIASPSIIQLYDYEEAKNFDKEKSVAGMAYEHNIVLPDETPLVPKYTSDSFSGINTLSNIKNGKYIAIAFFKPDGYTFPSFFYYGYKEITVNSDTNMKLYNFVFTWGDKNYGKFIAL